MSFKVLIILYLRKKCNSWLHLKSNKNKHTHYKYTKIYNKSNKTILLNKKKKPSLGFKVII